jgi:hypothetical protein
MRPLLGRLRAEQFRIGTNPFARRFQFTKPFDRSGMSIAAAMPDFLSSTLRQVNRLVRTKVREALKPGGRVVFVEYRKEDPQVPIKEVHKMSLEQLSKEMDAVGFVRVKTVESLPSQHIVIFAKRE